MRLREHEAILRPINRLIRWLRIAEFGMYGVVVCCIGLLTLIVHR